MSRGKDLIKNTGILMVAKVSTQIVSVILIPIYISVLTTSEYGEIDIYSSLIMVIVPMLTLQLEMGLFRYFIVEDDKVAREKIVSSAFFMIFSAIVLVALLYFIGTSFYKGMRYRGLIFMYYSTVAVYVTFLQLCRAEGKNISYGIASFLGMALSMVFNVIAVVFLGFKVNGILFSYILSHAIAIIYMFFVTDVKRYFKIFQVASDYCKKLLSYSVPLIFNQISSWVINYSDRIIILFVWGSSFNGIYSLANKFSNIINTFFCVYNVAWTENVVRGLNDSDRVSYINRVFSLTYYLYLAVITGMVNVLPLIFPIFFKDDYAPAYNHVPILLLAMFFSGMATTIGSIYIAQGKTKNVSVTTVMAGICNLAVHISLLKPCGLYAASLSTLVAFGALFVYRYISVQKLISLHFYPKGMILQMALFCFCAIGFVMKNIFLEMTGLAVNLCFVLVLINRNKDILHKAISRKISRT